MRRLILASLLTLLVASPAAASDLELGQNLVSEFFGAIRANNTKTLEEKIAPSVQSISSTGARDMKALMKRIADLKVEGAPVFTNWKVTREGPTVIVTYDLAISEVLDGKRTDDAPAPRMTVFLMTAQGWQAIAHANFKVAE